MFRAEGRRPGGLAHVSLAGQIQPQVGHDAWVKIQQHQVGMVRTVDMINMFGSQSKSLNHPQIIRNS